VKGLQATNEIKQLEAQDSTQLNKMEITLNAAKKRASQNSGDVALQQKKKQQEDDETKKREDGRAKLKNQASKWHQG